MVEARPYPWPYDGELDPRRLALVIAGAQAAWAAHSSGGASAAQVIELVSRAARRAGALVVHVRHCGGHSRSGLPPARQDDGWALATQPEPEDIVVDAAGVDGFYGGALDAVLRHHRRDTLVFCGFGAEAAVSSTLRSANDRGYEALTLIDGAAPFDPVTGYHSLHSITMSGGIFGAIAESSKLLAALESHMTWRSLT